MKVQTRKLNLITCITVISLIAVTAMFLCFAGFNVASATNNEELVSYSYVKDNQYVTEVLNIDNYVKSNQNRRQSISSFASKIFAKLGFSEEEINNLTLDQLKEILTVTKAITVEQFIQVDSDGNNNILDKETYLDRLSKEKSSMSRYSPGESAEESDIAGNGYMSSKITLYQDRAYDINGYYNKDEKTHLADYYGFRIETEMTWDKDPATRSLDAFWVSFGDSVKTQSQHYPHFSAYNVHHREVFIQPDPNVPGSTGYWMDPIDLSFNYGYDTDNILYNFKDHHYSYSYAEWSYNLIDAIPWNFTSNFRVGSTVIVTGKQKGVMPANIELMAGYVHTQTFFNTSFSVSGEGFGLSLSPSWNTKTYKSDKVDFNISKTAGWTYGENN